MHVCTFYLNELCAKILIYNIYLFNFLVGLCFIFSPDLIGLPLKPNLSSYIKSYTTGRKVANLSEELRDVL